MSGPETKDPWEAMGQIGADFIKEQLARPSPLRDLLPVLSGPYLSWDEGDGVVHTAGYLGDARDFVRVCDFRTILLGAECPGAPVSCLWCLGAPER